MSAFAGSAAPATPWRVAAGGEGERMIGCTLLVALSTAPWCGVDRGARRVVGGEGEGRR